MNKCGEIGVGSDLGYGKRNLYGEERTMAECNIRWIIVRFDLYWMNEFRNLDKGNKKPINKHIYVTVCN
jgi:hypothetical protein